MTYNGYTDFSDFFIINHIDLPFGSFKTSTQSNDTHDGVFFFKVSRGSYSLKIEATMISDESNNYRTIEQMRQEVLKRLQTKEIKPLTFSTMFDRYFNAIPSGEGMLSIVNPEVGKIELTFLIPDGVAHGQTVRAFPAYRNSQGTLEVAVDNMGTESTPVSYRCVNSASNTFLGVVSEYGAIQVGYEGTEEIDETAKMLIYSRSSNEDFATWQKGGFTTESYSADGTMGYTYVNGKKWLVPLSYGNNNAGKPFYGASITKKIPENGATDFIFETKVWFQPGTLDQKGLMQVIISTSTGRMIGFSLDKGTYGQITKVRLHNGETTGNMDVDLGANEYFMENAGTIRIERDGKKITFKFFNKVITYYVHYDDSEMFTDITLFNGRTTSAVFTRQYWDWVRFTKVIDSSNDASAIFSEGSTLYLDGATGRVYQDDIPIPDVDGSKWFLVPPGQTKIQFYHGSKVDPQITAEIREAYL